MSNLTRSELEELIAMHHPSERQALREVYGLNDTPAPTEALVTQGQYVNNWAVQYPDGTVEQCHNYQTARYLADQYNKRGQ